MVHAHFPARKPTNKRFKSLGVYIVLFSSKGAATELAGQVHREGTPNLGLAIR
jgi:hypothetical protein